MAGIPWPEDPAKTLAGSGKSTSVIADEGQPQRHKEDFPAWQLHAPRLRRMFPQSEIATEMIAHTRKTRPPSMVPVFLFLALLAGTLLLAAHLQAQTNCAEGNGVLDMAPPKTISPQELISKFGAEEAKVKQARMLYTYTQDVLVQTLSGTSVDGQFHEITTVSYDAKGKRVEKVTFAEQPTLRGIQLTAEDMDDIRVFMPLILTSDDLPQYKLTYTGQQHVDDLDTYVFLVEPKKEEKDKRYFQGRIWIDNHDLQIVKLCGKSVPEQIRAKKNQPLDLRPTFVTYRQPVDGYWFPAYTRVDDTLHFRTQSIQVREIIKLTSYKRVTEPAP